MFYGENIIFLYDITQTMDYSSSNYQGISYQTLK